MGEGSRTQEVAVAGVQGVRRVSQALVLEVGECRTCARWAEYYTVVCSVECGVECGVWS